MTGTLTTVLSISIRRGRLFGTRRLIETRRLLEHWPQNPGVDPAIIRDPAFIRSLTVNKIICFVFLLKLSSSEPGAQRHLASTF